MPFLSPLFLRFVLSSTGYTRKDLEYVPGSHGLQLQISINVGNECQFSVGLQAIIPPPHALALEHFVQSQFLSSSCVLVKRWIMTVPRKMVHNFTWPFWCPPSLMRWTLQVYLVSSNRFGKFHLWLFEVSRLKYRVHSWINVEGMLSVHFLLWSCLDFFRSFEGFSNPRSFRCIKWLIKGFRNDRSLTLLIVQGVPLSNLLTRVILEFVQFGNTN